MQAWLPIIISGLVLVVVAVQAYINKRQWDAMNRQVELMHSSLELEYRPKIAVQAERLADAGALNITIKNIGKTPANRVLTTYRYVTDIPPISLSEGQEGARNDLLTARYYYSRKDILPGSEIEVRVPITQQISPHRRGYVFGALEYEDAVTNETVILTLLFVSGLPSEAVPFPLAPTLTRISNTQQRARTQKRHADFMCSPPTLCASQTLCAKP
jgi:hypothetical protein